MEDLEPIKNEEGKLIAHWLLSTDFSKKEWVWKSMKIEEMKKGLNKLRYIMVADEERFTRWEKLTRHSIEALVAAIIFYFTLARYQYVEEKSFFSAYTRLVICILVILFFAIFVPYYRAGIKKRQKEERMEEDQILLIYLKGRNQISSSCFTREFI